MHHNGTVVLARHQPGPVSPVISGGNGWLGDNGHDQPLTLQLGLPASAGELAAALYAMITCPRPTWPPTRTCGRSPQWRSSRTG